MRIEEINALAEKFDEIGGQGCDFANAHALFTQAIEALRATAWYPIERAVEMGIKQGQWIAIWDGEEWYQYKWTLLPRRGMLDNVTHFRFITTPKPLKAKEPQS